jgi:very-short-patch-repair endonuclease
MHSEAYKNRLSTAQLLLGKHLEELGFRDIVYEHRITPERKWRADICADGPEMWHGLYLFECDGGKWHGGHRRGAALEKDYERQNWCQMHGYKLLRFTNEQILSGEALTWLKKHLS